jgi:hypothetical protein
VYPAPPAVFAVRLPPPFTVTALIATVLSVVSCVICSVKVDTPLVGTFVKSISVMFSVSVIDPVLPLFISIAITPEDEVTATSTSE